MPSIGFPELLVILVIALLVLGPKKLPEAGRAMGKCMREFKDSLSGVHDDDDRPATKSKYPKPLGRFRGDADRPGPVAADRRPRPARGARRVLRVRGRRGRPR